MWGWLMLSGLAAGAMSALLGVGGGIIMVPSLMMVFKEDIRIAVATSLAAMLPIVVVGLIRHYSLGNVNLMMAFWLALGGSVGAVAGASLTQLLAAATLQRIFGVLLLVVALRMIMGR